MKVFVKRNPLPPCSHHLCIQSPPSVRTSHTLYAHSLCCECTCFLQLSSSLPSPHQAQLSFQLLSGVLLSSCGLGLENFTGFDMFSPFVYMFMSLHPLFNTLSVAAHPAGDEDSPWFVGCVNASDSSVLGLHTSERGRDLDPVTCSARCLDEG